MNDLRGLELIILDILAKILRTPGLREYLEQQSPLPMPSKTEEISKKLWEALTASYQNDKQARASAKLEQDNAAKYYGKNEIEERHKRASAQTIKADADREAMCLNLLKQMPLLDYLSLDNKGRN